MLARLGDASQAEELRREKAEAALASDMAAFKAANPGCCIEDFVRWHSPKDWRPTADADASGAAQPPASALAPSQRPEGQAASGAVAAKTAEESTASSKRRRDGRRGELSVRMRHRSNRWQRLWKVTRRTARNADHNADHTPSRLTARTTESRDSWHWAVVDSLLCCVPCAAAQLSPPLPAFEQVPLFDCLTVGEKVLNDLEHVQPASLFSQLSGVAASNFLSAMARTPPAVHDLAGCRSRIAAVQGAVQPSASELPQLAEVERLCARATSLLYAFPLCLPLIDRLLVDGSAQVEGLEEREAVLSVFAVVEREKGSTSRATPMPGGGRRLPKPDRRSYTLFAPSAAVPSVGDRLHLHLFDDRDSAQAAYAAPSSTATASTTSSSSSNYSSAYRSLLARRFRHLKGGGRFSHRPRGRGSQSVDGGTPTAAELWSAEEMSGDLFEEAEEPTLRMATAWQTHWPRE